MAQNSVLYAGSHPSYWAQRRQSSHQNLGTSMFCTKDHFQSNDQISNCLISWEPLQKRRIFEKLFFLFFHIWSLAPQNSSQDFQMKRGFIIKMQKVWKRRTMLLRTTRSHVITFWSQSADFHDVYVDDAAIQIGSDDDDERMLNNWAVIWRVSAKSGVRFSKISSYNFAWFNLCVLIPSTSKFGRECSFIASEGRILHWYFSHLISGSFMSTLQSGGGNGKVKSSENHNEKRWGRN